MSQLPLFELGPKPTHGAATKTCSRCHNELDLEEFYSDRNYKHGVDHVCKHCTKQHDQVVRRFREMGLFEIQLRKQEGRCGICPSTEDLCVDVDHSLLQVRGLLCRKCNIMLGQLERVDAVVRYLRSARNGS